MMTETGPASRDDGGSSGRIAALAAEARRTREGIELPPDPPREARATAAARDGLGPVVARYIEAKTGEPERLTADQLAGLHRATNDWLAVYAAWYGVRMDPDVTVRKAAETLLDTHDIRTVARLLTGVPER